MDPPQDIMEMIPKQSPSSILDKISKFETKGISPKTQWYSIRNSQVEPVALKATAFHVFEVHSQDQVPLSPFGM